MPAADVERAAHLYGEAERASISWGLGVTEHRHGSDCVQLIANLALLTGKIGKPGCALLPLRGQNNVQGSSDMGALPDTFTAYRSVGDEETARLFEERWGVSMKRERGLKLPEMLDAALDGRVKAMWICGYDIAQSDPDAAHVDDRAREPRLPGRPGASSRTRRRSFADVILPGGSVPREDRHVHERRAAHAARAGGAPTRPARPRPTSRSTSSSPRGSGTSSRTTGPRT